METFIPEDFDKAQWYCAGDGVLIFGVQEGKEIVQKFALVKRRDDGEFDWTIAGTNFEGRESNKALAIDKVNNLYFSAIELRELLS